MSEEQNKHPKRLSRREFLKDAGLVVGGATIGSMALINACGSTTTVTAPGTTSTVTDTKTVTSTVQGPGGSTVTVTQPQNTITLAKYIDPYSNKEFTSLAELKAYLDQTMAGTGTVAELTALTVNGVQHVLANLEPSWSLMYVLREVLGYVGTKNGCNRGECGTCTVILNGRAVYSCVVLACEADGAQIKTVEGLSDKVNFTGITKAIYDTDALQCGYCAPGFIMASQALLEKNSKPTLDQVREALSGHICTCGNIKMYVDAVLKV